MSRIRAVILIFSTYTRIPVPGVKWDDDAMKFAIAFLPLVGAVIGGAVWVWRFLCGCFGFGAVLFAAVATALPIFITGGIHMDGYCDTSDALASRREKERKLEILKDPHAGAFAVIRSGVYLLICFALLHELFLRGLDTGIAFLYVLSRCFAVWSAMTMPNARKGGMLAAFTERTDRHSAYISLGVLTALGVAGWLWFTFPQGLAGLALCLPLTAWYRAAARKHFGGATGDTTGFYLQNTELTLLAGLLAGGVALPWL
jgi:adenosylcobinamide-GDP ribazoletransferase